MSNPKLYLPKATAKFNPKTRQIQIFNAGDILVNDVVEGGSSDDIDFWVEVEIDNKKWDFNLYVEGEECPMSLYAYEVLDGETNTSVWQTIPLTTIT